ncbi:MAG: S9 family peptidase [Anaerolineaceae bacterium]|nr:MAG: S9 family peptidase [Anaerolineaceae bacterium]
MTTKKIAPYGSWKSPITTDLIVAGTVRLGQIAVDGTDLYWTEGRPEEGGRNVVVRRAAGMTQNVDITPAPFNARTRVHEYGGGAFIVHEGVVTFANYADQRLYQQRPGGDPQAVTPEENLRFADGVFAADGRFVCVREDHRNAGQEAINTIVSLALDGVDAGHVLVSGNDFYATPRVSPDGKRLAWITWNHPNMPWDGTELWVADFAPDGTLNNRRLVAGSVDESIFQPEWSPDGVLHFVSDRNNWWNLYRWQDGTSEPLYLMEAELGLPQWVFGMRSYAITGPDSILCGISQNGSRSLAMLDTQKGRLTSLDLPFTMVADVQAAGDYAYFVGGAPDMPGSVIRLDLSSMETTVLRRSSDIVLDGDHLSLPQAIEFSTANGLTAYAFYYPPQNKEFQAPDEERPPLIVESHGGPTGATSAVFSIGKQYWTNRGFALLDVNYGGSTGYGRAYRQRLNGQWGIVDVEDCISGARYLVEQGLADGDRLAIHGGSAGGYTTLCALAFHDVFGAGASYFGVSDVEALAKETHKFESRYLDSMIGPYPERRDLYIERSPIHSTDQINCPLILFQGLEDRVVPPNQAEMMFEAVKAKGIPVAYLPFPGEQHGFRRAENIKRMLEAELYFYGKVFGFELADVVEEVDIENLPPAA